MKIDVFDYTTVVWRPLSRKPLQISAQTICRQKLESMAYISAAHSMGLSSFIFCGGLRKTHLFWNKMRIGRSRSSKVVDFGTSRKGVCDVLLVINSNFGPIWDTASYWLKIAIFSYPTLVWRPRWGGIPSEFLDETYRWKTRGMGLLYGENCMIITSAVFDWSTRVTDGRTDRRTDRRTDGIAIAYARLQHMLSRAKM